MNESSVLGFLEVHAPDGDVHRVTLAGDRMVIGRADGAEVRLDSATVSRRHAEAYADPFGRWWIRDLGSRNGTILNGEKIDESVLRNGDEIAIEDFRIVLKGAMGSQERRRQSSAAAVTLADAAGGQITQLQDLETPKIDASHLGTLTEFGTRLLSIDDPDARTSSLCRLLIDEKFHGTSAMVLRIDKARPDDQPELLGEPAIAPGQPPQPYISRTLLRAVRESEAPVVASNVGGSTGVMELSLAGHVAEMSAVACPLVVAEDVMDVLYVTFPGAYGTGEWLALAALAAKQHQQAEIAWDARRQAEQQAIIEKELERARQLQMRLVPAKLAVERMDLSISFEPCRWVGGDYVDVLTMPDGRVLLMCCDVCGKGLQAALITSSLHTVVHTRVDHSKSVGDIMEHMNNYLCDMLPDDSFVTAVGVTIDRDSGEMECVNAGHPPAMVVDAGGVVRELQSSQNAPLGFIPGPMEPEHDRIEAGAVLALFTDGLTELENPAGDMLEIEGVREALAGATTAGPEIDRICAKLVETLNAFQSTALPSDDRTFMLARRTD